MHWKVLYKNNWIIMLTRDCNNIQGVPFKIYNDREKRLPKIPNFVNYPILGSP